MYSRKRQSGFVLLVTVIIIAAITSIILAYSESVRIFHGNISGSINDTHLRNAARGGLEYAVAYLNNNKEISAVTQLDVDIDDVNCEIRIECENGKININNMVNGSDEYDRSYSELLLNLIDIYNEDAGSDKISYGLVPAIIDAIDKNNEAAELSFIQRNNKGAEKSYYKKADMPSILNKPFGNIYDMAFVKNCSGSTLTKQADEQSRNFIDCFTTERISKIDINSAPAEVIAALSEDISLSKARELEVSGKLRGYNTLEEFYSAAGVTNTSMLEGILETEPDNKQYTIIVSVKNGYKTLKLTAISKKDDNNIYNAKKMYCN